jgi:hypothetical protein
MTHWIFTTQADATAAAAIILRLGSLSLHLRKNLALRPDGVIAEGLRAGIPEPIDLNPLWDMPCQCAEGWAIASPVTWCIEDSVTLWTEPLTAPLSTVMAALGRAAPVNDALVTMTGAEWSAMALAGMSYVEGVPTFPDVDDGAGMIA